MIAEIDEFSVYDEMLWLTGQTGRHRLFQSRGPAVANDADDVNDRLGTVSCPVSLYTSLYS